MIDRTRALRGLAALAAGCGLSLAAAAQTVTMEGAGTASPTGMIPQALAKYAAREGVQVQLALNQTLTKSLLKVAAGQINSAVVPPSAFLAMKAGKGPYRGQAEKAKALSVNVRSIFGFMGSTFQTIVWADSGIKSWADIKGKRVYIGPPAGAANAQMKGMIKAASGYEEGRDYKGVKVPWGAAQQGFQDGQYDVYVAAAAIGQQTLVELSLQRAIRILPMPKGMRPGKHLQLEVDTIPAKTYPGLVNGDQDLTAWGTTMMMSVNKNMPNKVAYELTKAYWSNIGEIRSGNALLRNQDPGRPFVGIVAPLHPGALRYYKEAGIKVPAALLPK